MCKFHSHVIELKPHCLEVLAMSRELKGQKQQWGSDQVVGGLSLVDTCCSPPPGHHWAILLNHLALDDSSAILRYANSLFK